MVEKNILGNAPNDVSGDALDGDKTDAAGTTAASNASSAPPSTPKKKRSKKLVIGVTLASVAALLVVAGVGFTVWHEQPGFCNAICHQPMDAYVEGYDNDATQFLAAHKQEAVNCIDCHDPGIGEQVNEAVHWVQGDFVMDADTKMLETVGVTADMNQCAIPECHNFDEVIATTENWGGEAGVNPHQSHQGTGIDCSNCHSSHSTSYMYCNTCHEYELPAGWENPNQSATSS
jgi:nitrate reductase NapE component